MKTVVNGEAYSLVKNTSDVTLIREHDGLSYGASSRKLWLNYSYHSFLNLPRNKVSRKIKRTPEGNGFFVVQERYRQWNFRYIRDESSNSDDDSPRLLNALSSWWVFILHIDEGVVCRIRSKISFPQVGSKAKTSLWREHQAVGKRGQAHAVPNDSSSWGFS